VKRAAFPSYDRSAVTVGIVHIGVGGFHRAHEAMYVDRLLTGGATDWGICGVGTQPAERLMRDALDPQDWLFTLLLKATDGSIDARVIGSLVDYIYAPDDPEGAIETMAAPSTRIVSLTITEGGYHVDLDTLTFASTEPGLLLDLQPGHEPTTVFGLVTEALRRRRARGIAPFTIMSCDNLPHNGAVARIAFAGFADNIDPALGEFVRNEVAFPSAMVDRITPATTDDDRELAGRLTGLRDAWPVVAEPFEQWVLQDEFPTGRPPWEQAGVQMVSDVGPYELMKLRLLNAGHQVIGYLGWMAGYRYTDQVCGDVAFRALLSDYMEREAAPTLPPVPGVDIAAYRGALLTRFANPFIRDTLSRLCEQASDRIPTFLLPVIHHQLATGGEVSRSALVIAAWARYAEGADEAGRMATVVDRRLEEVRDAASAQRRDPTAFLTRLPCLRPLAANDRFVSLYLGHVHSLREIGAKATVTAVNAGPKDG
jgi:mannitol 2-dehydrogenase